MRPSKTIAAQHDDKKLPRIHTVVYSKSQLDDASLDPAGGLEGDAQSLDGFQILFAGSVEESVFRLAYLDKATWGRIIDQSRELDAVPPPQGAEREAARLVRFLNARTGGYMVIRGAASLAKVPWPLS